MHTYWKKGLALGLSLMMAALAVTGCSKKDKKDDGSAAMLTLTDGGTISQGTANLILRYQQAGFETGIGSFLRSYYGDIWNSDLTGSGQPYGATFKDQVSEDMVHMLLAEAHQGDYGIELTADEKSAITEAAKALLEWGHEHLGIRRFIAHCDAENLPSQGVMRKLGMTLADDTGTRRNRGSDEERRELRFEREL